MNYVQYAITVLIGIAMIINAPLLALGFAIVIGYACFKHLQS